MKMESGDTELMSYFENGPKNAQYTSPTIQNELIAICGEVVKQKLVDDIKKAHAYSILADETADISGKEQLSIGVRFYDHQKNELREELLGFVVLEKMDAHTIATQIKAFFTDLMLDENKCVGQGYDGCATMAGKEGGVQKILQETYRKGLYFHCASHKLNLVVNDLNSVSEIRNCIGTVKDIINFFRESTLRRSFAPNIPLLCETRWSQKYKSIGLFNEKFVDIMAGLEKLSCEGNAGTRKAAFQLLSAAGQTIFILSLCLVAKYSKIIEPVANILQSKSLDVIQCSGHIKHIISVVKDHRQNVDDHSSQLLNSAKNTAEAINVELHLPRIVSRQKHRSNPPAQSLNEYFKRALYVPYLDSLISSLESRFNEENSPAYFLALLHPTKLFSIEKNVVNMQLDRAAKFYGIKDLQTELELWRSFWVHNENKDVNLIDLLKETENFYPHINEAIHILLALPYTTASIERTFSTLRRVKTWLRSTMLENRLNGLCMLSIHRKIVKTGHDSFVTNVLARFSENSRKLVLS